MNERQEMAKLKKHFLNDNIWCCIIYDGPDFAGRPFDMLALYEKRLVAIEGKFQKSFKAFGMNQIRDNQRANLDMVHQSGGMAYIFLFIWIPNQEHRLYIWKWDDFKKRAIESSIKAKELKEMSHITLQHGNYKIPEILEHFSCYDI